MARIVIVGTGIVGLAVAARLAERGDDVVVLDKEHRLAAHQTGRNSGVIHSGLYYAPGSLKARMSRAGARSMAAFAAEHGVATERTGKLVVATDDAQVPGLHKLADRAKANDIEATLLSGAAAREHEPHVRAVAALHVPSTGIVDYRGVCDALARTVVEHGGEIRLGTVVAAARTQGDRVVVETSDGDVTGDAFVNCAGLFSDRLAAASGLTPDARIVPFRGEYFELVPERADLVRGLIYPVPDPRFPFLGVHLTKMVNGSVHAGPNAVLALAREGYRWSDVNARDVVDALSWPGLWRLGARNLRPGAQEVLRSLSRARFAASLAELVPEITAADLVPSAAGVRAQAMRRDGTLVDDFLVQRAPRQVHVLNAPSPAATAALEIAAHLVTEVDAVRA
ncbi:L-2-hydroxyglutarate oxidase [Cellulomonas xylanilytica]|uniref:Hydroxyglutarate oxidase n=1 Tax=Cellulomonas xylanilytica TaxID=233583 RepID=A0A510V6V9_9CELL|nr:L-2-hydroxyglutarate oxidase [Cellulomonas xylanilytica]GEK21661.1 hydroxyglutarate oxidase [Cellulomonas xylanilytica]